MKTKLALLSWLAAMCFAVAGIVLPPVGKIDSSILILVAQLLILCATFLGVKEYYDVIKAKLAK